MELHATSLPLTWNIAVSMNIAVEKGKARTFEVLLKLVIPIVVIPVAAFRILGPEVDTWASVASFR